MASCLPRQPAAWVDMDLGAWVLALAVLWAMRLARVTVQESVGLGWTPLNVSLGVLCLRLSAHGCLEMAGGLL